MTNFNPLPRAPCPATADQCSAGSGQEGPELLPGSLPHGAKSIGMPREEAVRHDHVRARQIEAGGRRLVRTPTDNPDRSLRMQLLHDPPVKHIAPGFQVVDVRDEEKNVHRLHGVEGRRKTRRGRCRRQRPRTRSRRPRRTPRTGAPAALRTWTTARGGLVVGRVAAVRHRGAAPVPRASEEQRDQGTRPRRAPPATSWC